MQVSFLCRKFSKAPDQSFQIFYVIEGAVNFKIHETSMVVATGGMFMVPRGELRGTWLQATLLK